MFKSLFVGLAVSALTGVAMGQSSLPVDPGELVATCCSGVLGPLVPGAVVDPNGYVVVLFDTRDPVVQGAPLGGATGNVNWNAPSFHNEPVGNPNSWTAAHLGQVFGIALDTSQANPDIYVAATTIYGVFATTFGPGGSGAVYKLDGTTGAICLLTTLPNASGASLGNIAIDPVRRNLYVSNFDDGLIYRVPLSAGCPLPAGTALGVYDHGVQGRGAAGMPTIPNNTALPYTQVGRRVFGLAFNDDEQRLYYAVWWESAGSGRQNAAEDNEVWSVAVDSLGNAVPNTATLEFKHPTHSSIGGVAYSNPASDLSFAPSGKLLLAERTRTGDSGQRLVGGPFDAHLSRVIEYSGGHLAWIAEPLNKYKIGYRSDGLTVGPSSAGGVAADCDENVWVTGDALHFPSPYIYGLQRIPSGGNATHSPPNSQSYMIDLDGSTGLGAKTELGDVAIRNNCCAEIIDKQILCQTALDFPPGTYPANGSYSYTFCFKNNSGRPIQYVFLRPPAGGDFNPIPVFSGPNPIPLPNPVPIGATSPPITVTINNQTPGSRFCFGITFADPNIDDCCLIEHCIDLPECDCVQFPVCDVACGTTPGTYSLNLVAQNLGNMNVNEFYAIAQPPGTAPFSIVLSSPVLIGFGGIPPGQSWPQMTFAISGATPGSTICIRFSMHLNGLECCSELKCISLPLCDGVPCPDCPNPTILVHPTPADICAGDDAEFVVVASVDPECSEMTCHWRKDEAILSDGPTPHGSVISGATTQQLTITNAGPQDQGAYDNVVAASCGTVTSDSAPLTVVVIPGDADHDNEVDFADVTKILENWGLVGPDAEHADVDGDGDVDFQDITVVLTFFGQACE